MTTGGTPLRIARAEIGAKLLANSQLDPRSGSWAIQFDPSTGEWGWLLVEQSRMDFDGRPWGLKATWTFIVLPHLPKEAGADANKYAAAAEGFIEQAKKDPQNLGMPFPELALL